MNQRNLLRMAVMLAFMPFRGQVVAQPLTWSLAPSAPEVTDITHGAIGDRFFTETHSSTPGTVSINVVTNNKTTGIGTITITGPASVTGALDEAKGNLNLSTAAAFTIRSSISNTTFNQVTAFTQDGTRTAQTASLSFNVNTLTATTLEGPLKAFLAVWVDFTLPIFPDAPNLGSHSYIRYKIAFKWLVTPVCPALAAASARKSSPVSPAASFCTVDPDLAIDRIEVVQSVQQGDPVNPNGRVPQTGRVPLIRGREAIVRVFVRSVGENAGKLSDVKGSVFVERSPNFRFPEGVLPFKTLTLRPVSRRSGEPEPVAPAGIPDGRSRDHSLDFSLPEWYMSDAITSISVNADVWLEPTPGKREPETGKSANNSLTVTIPVPLDLNRRANYFIGVAPVCLKGKTIDKDKCPDKPSPSGVESWFPAKTQISRVHLPRITINDTRAIDSPEAAYRLAFETFWEYLKARQLMSIFPIAQQPEADQLIVNVYGDQHDDEGAEKYFGIAGGLATAWIIRTNDSWTGSYGDHQVAHGIGHNLGLDHYFDNSKIDSFQQGYAPYGWGQPIRNEQPLVLGSAGITTGPEIRTGFAVARSIMDVTLSNDAWVSPGEFNKMFANFPPLVSAAQKPSAKETLIISGGVAKDGQSGTLNTAVRAPTTIPPPASDPKGETCVEAHSDSLDTTCFVLNTFGLATPASFARVIPFPEGTRELKLKHRGKELASLKAGTPPAVAVTSPAGGETWQGPQTIRWTATGNSPSFTLQYSPDDGTSWLPLSATLTVPQYSFNTEDIIGGDRVRFRVLASSGLETTIATSGAVRVPQNTVLTSAADEIRFSNLTIGEQEYAELALTNTGTGRLWVLPSPPSNPAFTIDGTASDILSKGESFTLRIRFAPVTSGPQQGTLRIGSKTIVLRGATFANPTPSIDLPARVDFGEVPAGKLTDGVLTVANRGGAALTVTSLTATGAGYSVTGKLPSTIQPGDFADFALRLSPTGTGQYLGQVIVSSNDPSATQQVVALAAQASNAPFPVATAAGILNAGSFKGGAVAPGELVTIFGSNMGPAALSTLYLDAQGRVATDLNGARVLFDGVPAPVIYTLAAQASVIVPYSVAGKTSTQMVAEYQRRRSPAVTVPVVAAAPGLFSANSSGSGPGAILNQNGSLNTAQNPAPVGSTIVLYGTGEGAVTPAVTDGVVNATVFPKPVLPLSVTIGGRAATVRYAGAAPNLVAGILQVNVDVPAGLTTGPQPVIVTVGTAASQPGLTVAVAGSAPTSAPVIEITPVSLDFGPVSVGQSSTRTLTLRNTGTAALNITARSSSNALFAPVDSAPPFTLQAGQSQTMTFRFTPTAAGVAAGTLTISSNDPARPSVQVTASGTATEAGAPVIGIPFSVDFGSVVVGQSSTRAIAVTNNGTASLTVSNVTSSNSQFAQMDSFAPFTVQPGGSQSITFRFTPTAAGTPVGQIVISSNAPGQTTVQVNVSGTATAAGGTGGGGGANLLCNGSFEQPGTTAGFVTLETGSTAMPCWRVVSGNIDFVHRSYWTPSDGNISLDMNGNTAGVIAQTFTTTPNGVYTVTFDLAGAPGAPVKQLQVSAAGQSSNRTFDSTNKSATNMGWSRETFTFTANAASTTLQFSSLSGVTSFGPALDNVCVVAGTGSCSGTGGGTGTPSIGLTPTSVNFGSVVVGQSVTRTVAVTNTGAGPLTVSFVSSTNSQFAPIDSFPPFTVAPGASQTMTFRFTPTQVGTPSGTVTISSNAFNLPSAQFSVSGTATAAGGGGGGTLPAITFGQTINGTLTSATPGRASDCSNCYADIYQLTVTASRTIVITLNSAVFDAYLNVIDASGRIVGSDDDSGGGLNARVSGTITPGVYRIEVTTANDRETGSYTLSIAP